MMISIKLERREWRINIDTQLGASGGFGSVFLGYDDDDNEVAIKRLKNEEGLNVKREITIAQALFDKDFQNILPFLDAGFDEETQHYYIVMPRADYDLDTFLAQKGILTEEEAVEIILEIAKGLDEANDLVHRDLKPKNVLFHNNNWKIADFGIAKFVEDATSANTLKGFRSRPYAAPEQWRLETATHATDIYALGITAYQMLNNSLPFVGPDYQDQHLHQEPPPITGINRRLSSLVILMLAKSPDARPGLDRITQIIGEYLSSLENEVEAGPGLDALSQANEQEAIKIGEKATRRSKEQTEQERRELLAATANTILLDIVSQFAIEVEKAAPTVEINKDPQSGGLLTIQIGTATLQLHYLRTSFPFPKEAFSQSSWDVIGGSFIKVTQSEPKKYEWGANLWYTDLGKRTGYRWWEVSYMHIGSRNMDEPFAIEILQEADLAASQVMHTIQFGTEPRPIDGDRISNFIDRWSNVLANAYNGILKHPTSMPMNWD